MKNKLLYALIAVLTGLTVFFGLVSFGIISLPSNMEEIRFYGVITAWDPQMGDLTLSRSDGTEQLFAIDPKIQKVMWANVNDQKIEISRQTLTTKDDLSWTTFFCPGENVLTTAKRKLGEKTYRLTEVLNIGKRGCQ